MKFEKVSSTGEEMITRRKTEQKYTSRKDTVLGFDAYKSWRTLQRLRTRVARSHGNVSSELQTKARFWMRRYKEDISVLRENLKELSQKDQKALKCFFSDYLSETPADMSHIAEDLGFDYENDDTLNQMISDEARVRFQRDPSRDFGKIKAIVREKCITEELAHILVSRFSAGQDYFLSDDMLMKMVGLRVKEIRSIKEEFQKECEKYKEEFREKAKEFLHDLGIDGLDFVIDERLDIIHFLIIDTLTSTLFEKWGDFRAHTMAVRISYDVPPSHVRSVIFHELFHAISGQTESVYEKLDFHDGTRDYIFSEFNEITRSGIDFVPPEMPSRRGKKPRKFFWLNEALTEQATIDVLHLPETRIYKTERELLELLITTGVPREILYKAYFENYETKEKGEHRNLELLQLFQWTNDHFGRGFLIALDAFIRENTPETLRGRRCRIGCQKAVEKWKELGDEFPAFILNEFRKSQ